MGIAKKLTPNDIVMQNARFLHEGCYYVQVNGTTLRAESTDKLVDKVREHLFPEPVPCSTDHSRIPEGYACAECEWENN